MQADQALPEYSFKTGSDRSVPGYRVCLMRASPRMDLLLLAAGNGDLLLYRWGWERVWLAPRPNDLPAAAPGSEEDCPVTCLDWRPDGQVALVAYADGRLRHLSLEDGSLLHEDRLAPPSGDDEGPALCSHWALLDRQFKEPWTRAGEALPSFADLGAGIGDPGDWARRMERQLSLLALASRRYLHLLAYGVCRMCRVPLSDLLPAWDPGLHRPASVLVSDDLACVSVAVRGGPQGPALLRCATGLEAGDRCGRVRRVALTVVQLTQLCACLRKGLRDIRECWEDSVHELDQKFADYSKDRDEYATAMGEPDWQLRTDLMALLLTGHCHPKFREFLCEGLSRAGLVRIGRGIEATLGAVQRHNGRQLQVLLFALAFHLGELADAAAATSVTFGGEVGDSEEGEEEELDDDCGLVERQLEAESDSEEDGDGETSETRLGGLDIGRVSDALSYCGSTLAKSLELGAAIERSQDSLRAFCEWLYVQILRLSKEPVARSLQRCTAQRRRLVTDFIRCQLAEGGERRFRLDLVGQYLADAPLAALPDCATAWQRVLERHYPNLTACDSAGRRRPPCLVVPDRTASLAQSLGRLCERVAAACRLAEPRRLRRLGPPHLLAGLRPLAQGHMGKQSLYHAALLHQDRATCLLVRLGGPTASPASAEPRWWGVRFSCQARGDEFADLRQLDAGQFAALLTGASATSALVVVPLALLEQDWTPLPVPAAVADLAPLDLSERLGPRLCVGLQGRGVALAAERRLLVSVLFDCGRRLHVCLLEPFCEGEDEDEAAAADADGDGDASTAASGAVAPMEQ